MNGAESQALRKRIIKISNEIMGLIVDIPSGVAVAALLRCLNRFAIVTEADPLAALDSWYQATRADLETEMKNATIKQS
jgi:hypothetical protein